MNAAMIVGASRGIGLALVREYLARGYEHVIAAARAPEQCAELVDLCSKNPLRLRSVPLDVTDEDRVAEAAERVADIAPQLHRLVVCAGMLHGPDLAPEKRLEHLDAERLLRAFLVNSVGPALVAKHFVKTLRHPDPAVFAALSARVGSISDNRLGGWYGYRASKAAQNMLMKTLSIELKRRAPNVICASLHPGTVDTDLSAPFSSGLARTRRFSPTDAARRLIAVMDSLRPEETGRFFAWDRKEIPW